MDNEKVNVTKKLKKGEGNMKRNVILSIMGAVMMVLGGASVSLAAISGTSHDFTATAWGGGEICKPCHTPHNAQVGVLIWNHDTTNAVHTDYVGYAMSGTPAVDATSKVCLSCHDGSVALDAFGGGAAATFIAGNAALGIDLSNDHPIGFSYTGVVDAEINQPPTDATIQTEIATNDILSCASCHDVHGVGNPKLLRIANTGSALCLACHGK